MIKYPIIVLSVFFAAISCTEENDKKSETQSSAMPQVENEGLVILFSNDSIMRFFKTEKLQQGPLEADYTALAKVAATILPPEGEGMPNVVLFENPNAAEDYTLILQHNININQIKNVNVKQKEIILSNVEDLLQHGAATGHDLLQAKAAVTMEKTNLANERASLMEYESKLRTRGFDPKILKDGKPGKVYVICNIPEDQVDKIKKKQTCEVSFSAFADKVYTGVIDNIANVLDNVTRMVKLYISLDDPTGIIKTGMFAKVSIKIIEKERISINETSLVTVQGESYVFVKTAPTKFERRKVEIGGQIGKRIIVIKGLKDQEEVATEGVMQLKGLSFGY